MGKSAGMALEAWGVLDIEMTLEGWGVLEDMTLEARGVLGCSITVLRLRKLLGYLVYRSGLDGKPWFSLQEERLGQTVI